MWGGYGRGKVRGEKGEGMKVYIFCLYMINFDLNVLTFLQLMFIFHSKIKFNYFIFY